jgi:hypothetical protein
MVRRRIATERWLAVAVLALLGACIPGAQAQGFFSGLYGSDSSSNSLRRVDGNVTTVHGCLCLYECDLTFDAFAPWCYTSEPNGDLPDRPCGFYSQSRNAYWDECTLNVTSGSAAYLSTYSGIYFAIVNAAVPTGAAPFFITGLFVAWPLISVHGQWWALALPIVYGAYGAFVTFVPVAVLAIGIAQIYLAMPYAPPVDDTVLLGVALALPVAYYHLGRNTDSISQFQATAKSAGRR